MFLFPTLVIATALATTPAQEAGTPPSPELLRQTVARSLVFLEKSGTGWWNGNKCASCHHVPITIWSLTEAKKYGFAVNDQSLGQLRNAALASYVNHPNLKPVGQDGGGNGLSLNTVYLSLAAASATQPDEQAMTALKKFSAHLIAKQEADGSWKSEGKMPPVEDISEVRTMLALLTLSLADQKGVVEDNWKLARDRGLEWLRQNTLSDRNQSLVLQVLVAQRFGKPDEVQALAKQLVEQQNADWGWSQIKERSSDALATGQSLYALAMAGDEAQQSAIQRAQAFLTRTQTTDGSWLVPIRAQKNTGKAISHYGSGWAAIGLMRSLPAPMTNQETGEKTELPAKGVLKLAESKK